jgi:hypothetical protein
VPVVGEFGCDSDYPGADASGDADAGWEPGGIEICVPSGDADADGWVPCDGADAS